jgi:hypothetical protein
MKDLNYWQNLLLEMIAKDNSLNKVSIDILKHLYYVSNSGKDLIIFGKKEKTNFAEQNELKINTVDKRVSALINYGLITREGVGRYRLAKIVTDGLVFHEDEEEVVIRIKKHKREPHNEQ